MAPTPDAPRSIRPSRVCEICGVLRQTRQKWIDRGLLQERSACGEIDLMETVVLRILFATIRKSHVRIAWQQIQHRLRETIPNQGLTIIWDVERREATLVTADASVIGAVRHGRPVQVIPLDEPIAAAREAFRKEIAAINSGELSTTRLADDVSVTNVTRLDQ
jgi:hypothetical protein